MKQATLYEVRCWPTPTAYSKQVGRKLKPRNRAMQIAKWLKRRGVDAYAVPVRLWVK